MDLGSVAAKGCWWCCPFRKQLTRFFFHFGCSKHVGRIHSEYPCPEMNILAFSNIPIEVSYIYPVTLIIEVFQSWIVTHYIIIYPIHVWTCLNLSFRCSPRTSRTCLAWMTRIPCACPATSTRCTLVLYGLGAGDQVYRLQFNLKSTGLR